jgi:polyphosphate kinase
VYETVLDQNNKFEKIYSLLLCELAKHRIHLVSEKQLTDDQAAFVRSFFASEVRARLMPFMFEKDTELPNLTDDAIFFASSCLTGVRGKKDLPSWKCRPASYPVSLYFPTKMTIST